MRAVLNGATATVWLAIVAPHELDFTSRYWVPAACHLKIQDRFKGTRMKAAADMHNAAERDRGAGAA